MNILIISTNRNRLPMPVMPVGACMVAEAAERAGHSVRMLDLMFERDALAALQAAVVSGRPDVVGLSVRNIDNNDMRAPMFFLEDLPKLVAAIRSLTDARIVLGGASLGVMPEDMLRFSGADCAVMGDGEVVFPLLLERLSAKRTYGDLPGVISRENNGYRKTACGISGPFNDVIAPDFQKWLNVSAYRSQLSTVPVQTKIGCQFQCVYCTYRKIEGSAYRLGDPGSVADAVERLSAAGLRDIEFVDSVFNAPLDHALDLCRALSTRKHNARLQSLELNPLHVNDELLDAMTHAGFVGIGITAESASDQVLRGLRKGFTTREVHAAADAVRRHKLPCAWIFLMGGPGETRETVRETLRFAEQQVRKSDVVFMNIGIRIYPGTELEAIARKQGLLTVSPAAMLTPVFYVSPDVSAAWIRQEIQQAMERNMNFINTDSIGLSILPAIHRIASKFGVRPPLWKHTRFIRRGLRMIGMRV